MAEEEIKKLEEEYKKADREAFESLKVLRNSIRELAKKDVIGPEPALEFMKDLAEVLKNVGDSLVKLEKARWKAYWLSEGLKKK